MFTEVSSHKRKNIEMVLKMLKIKASKMLQDGAFNEDRIKPLTIGDNDESE